MEDVVATALQGIAVSLGSIAATLASVWAVQRARGTKQSAARESGEHAAASVVSVREADRRALAAKQEADRANDFANLRRMVEEHHKDDEDAFARHQEEIRLLRESRHQVDSTLTALQFGLAATDRHLAETRVLAGIDSTVRPNPLLQEMQHRTPGPRPPDPPGRPRRKTER